MSDLRRRLERMEAIYQAPADGPPMMTVIIGDDWSAADQAIINSDDRAAKAETIERHTGQRPGRDTRLIVFAMRDDGPQ